MKMKLYNQGKAKEGGLFFHFLLPNSTVPFPEARNHKLDPSIE